MEPKTKCSVCGQLKQTYINGKVVAHNYNNRFCPGSGRPPRR